MAKEHDDDVWRQLATHAHAYHSSEDPHFREHYAGLVSKHFADGGVVNQDEPDLAPIGHNNPPASRGFRIMASGNAPVQPEDASSHQFQQLEPGSANPMRLATIFDDAIKRHLSLSRGEQIANTKKAIGALEPYIGKGKSGPISVLSQSSKQEKTAQSPIRLPDGRGIETWALSLSPDYKEGDMKLCPNAAVCTDECVGSQAGQYSPHFAEAQTKAGLVSAPERSKRRTLAMLREPEAFAIRMYEDINSLKNQASMNGNHLAVRPNNYSDLNPRIFKSIIEAHPDVSFYDYTKMPGYKNASDSITTQNHHLTYSSTGVSQDGVDNEHQNWPKMRRFLDRGDNVAMVFTGMSRKKGQEWADVLPKFVHDKETGKKYRVVDGVSHDFRPYDIQPEGADGVIVGLVNKKSTGNKATAHLASKGFMVKYDPQTHGDTVPIKPQAKKGD